MFGEALKYKVLQKSKNFEIRQYQEYLIASIEIDSDFTQASGTGFGILSDYILGHNWSQKRVLIDGPAKGQKVEGEKIGMTNPVLAAAGPGGYVISFIMPSRFSKENLPEPFHKRIKIRDVMPFKAAVLKFHGNLDDQMIEKQTLELQSWLTHNTLTYKSGFFFAQYNSPGIPARFRRNEIIAELD
jgi:SOUL heme-binding protein